MSNLSIHTSYVQQAKVTKDKQYMIYKKNDMHVGVSYI